MSQNCLGYALGLTGNVTSEVYERTFEKKEPNAVKAFVEKLDELGFIATEVYCTTPSKEDQFLVAFWGLFPYPENFFGATSYVYDFHVARQERDGTWTHKWGWNYAPEHTTIESMSREYGIPYFFSIRRKKAP